jgi:protein-disulfide isomerase
MTHSLSEEKRDGREVKLDTVLTGILIGCALVTTGFLVRHEMFNRSARMDDQAKRVRVDNWGDYADRYRLVGGHDAPVQIVEFADFECPYCAEIRKTLRIVEQRHPGKIAISYVHFPIRGHRFAVPAARVAECANDQGRFEAMYDRLFEWQDQFGLKPWDDYAAAAGVPDMATFDACIKKTDPVPRVEEGKALGAKLNVQATPTIIINGWKLGKPPAEQELDQMVQRILAGKSPVS